MLHGDANKEYITLNGDRDANICFFCIIYKRERGEGVDFVFAYVGARQILFVFFSVFVLYVFV